MRRGTIFLRNRLCLADYYHYLNNNLWQKNIKAAVSAANRAKKNLANEEAHGNTPRVEMTRPDHQCIRQYAIPAETSAKFLLNQMAANQFSVVIALREVGRNHLKSLAEEHSRTAVHRKFQIPKK